MRDAKRAWPKVRKAAKLPDDVRLYDATKHTPGDYLVQAGAPDSVIGDVLGVSPKTVQVYRAVRRQVARKAVQDATDLMDRVANGADQ